MESAEDVFTRLGAGAGELVRLVPELADRVPGLDPPTESDAETERTRLHEAVGEWLRDASLDEPIVLILDSLHWGGPATFHLLQHALPMLDGARVMVVAMQRERDDRMDDLVRCARDELGPAAGVTIALEGLDASELAELLGLLHRDDAQRQDAQLLHTVTGGNPLHLNEILRAPGAGASLPDTIHEAVQLHLDRLELEPRRVVESAAVLGAEFEARCLAEMTGQLDVTLDALDAAVEAGLLIDEDRAALRYRFVHDVTRQTAIDGIGAGRMTRLHEQAGKAIEAVGGGENMLAELALHFAAAVPLGHRDKAVEYSARAAERAARQYANESAEALYRQALELLDPDGDAGRWCDLAIGRGEALRRLGDPEHRSLLLEVADRACALGDPECMARALITTYRGTFSYAMKVDEEYVDRLRRAVDGIGDRPSKTRARLLSLLGVETAWAPDQEECRRVTNESVAVARSLGDPDLLTSVLAHRQWVVFHPLSERLRDMEELAELAERCTDPLLRFDALGNEAFTRTRQGDRDGLVRAMERLRISAAEVDQPLVRWMLNFRESAFALMEARFDAAERHIEEGREIAQKAGHPDAGPQYVAQRFWLNLETQPLEAARELTRTLALGYHRMPPMTSWSSIAMRAAELGFLEEAERILEAMDDIGFETIPKDQRWLVTICGLGAVAAAVGDERVATRLYEMLAPHASENANVIFAMVGSVERYLGLLGACLRRHDAVEQHLRRAIVANREIGAVTWLARSQLDYAEWRLERDTFDAECQGLLDEATASATRLGLPSVLERAEQIARCR
jgi:tetratricopeptide (TPR) repeat protein